MSFPVCLHEPSFNWMGEKRGDCHEFLRNLRAEVSVLLSVAGKEEEEEEEEEEDMGEIRARRRKENFHCGSTFFLSPFSPLLAENISLGFLGSRDSTESKNDIIGTGFHIARYPSILP